jgi:signal transduction histidine kinase
VLFRDLLRRWRALPVGARDAAIPLLLVVGAVTPGLAGAGIILGDLPERRVDIGAVLLAGGQCLPLAVGRRYPVRSLAVILASFAAYQVLGYPATVASLGVLVAIFTAATRVRPGRRVLTAGAAAAAAGYAALAVVLHDRGSPETGPGFVTFPLVPGAAWLLGAWLRDRAARERELRERRAALAIAEERARIARELHDVVTHHVTAMVVQAGAAGYLVGGDPAKLADGLRLIGGTGRRALAELRYLLDVLGGAADGGGARHPGLGDAAALVSQVRDAGQPVGFRERGGYDGVPDEVQLAAYRVVQEALTNAVKYAAGQDTDVDLRRGGDALEVTVRTVRSHRAGRGRDLGGSGRGLAGLAARVSALGGSLEAGPDREGSFMVHAVFPSAGWTR